MFLHHLLSWQQQETIRQGLHIVVCIHLTRASVHCSIGKVHGNVHPMAATGMVYPHVLHQFPHYGTAPMMVSVYVIGGHITYYSTLASNLSI